MNKLSIREVVRYGFSEFARHWKFFMSVVAIVFIIVGGLEFFAARLLKTPLEKERAIHAEQERHIYEVRNQIEKKIYKMREDGSDARVITALAANMEDEFYDKSVVIYRESLSQTIQALSEHWLQILVAILLTFIVNMGMFLGMLRVCLEYHDTGKRSFKTLFSCFGMLPKAFGVSLVFLLIFIGNLVWQVIAETLYNYSGARSAQQWIFSLNTVLLNLLLMPAYFVVLYFVLRFAFVFFAMLDHKTVVQSWKYSWQMSKGNFWRLFVLLIPLILLTNWYLQVTGIGGWLRPYLLALIALIFAVLCMPYLLIWTRSYRTLEAENGQI